ncbi:MAG: hypothetical protein RL153_852 [Verrucomicrobiota bacterium]
MPAVWGRRSLTHAPDWPWRRNSRLGPSSVDLFLNDESMNAKRLPFRNESGIAWPCSRRSSGFQSNNSNWEGPPAMNR